MTEESEPNSPTPEEEAGGDGKSSWWERLLKIGRNIVNLERSVTALKAENKQLRIDVQSLQLQVERLVGKLEGVTELVSGAIEDKIEAKVAKAEIRVFERLLTMVRDSQREKE
ncbi:MAG TPA: hypothetical protein VEH76_11945 [Methylocystis sp.]|nr:hypothetical protein [Methylocystis sp.]